MLTSIHEDGDHAAPIDDWSPKVSDPCRQTEVRRALTAALDALPADARTAVILRDVEGLSVAEVAAALGLTITNAKTRIHRARLVLRQHLAVSLR